MCRAVKSLVNEDIFRLREAEESSAGAASEAPWKCPECHTHNPPSVSVCRQQGSHHKGIDTIYYDVGKPEDEEEV